MYYIPTRRHNFSDIILVWEAGGRPGKLLTSIGVHAQVTTAIRAALLIGRTRPVV